MVIADNDDPDAAHMGCVGMTTAPLRKKAMEAGGAWEDRAALRRAMGRFVTGVTVVTTCGPGGKFEGVTSNSFSSVSLDPPLVLWSLALRAGSFASFSAASHFVINVLALDQLELSKHFAAPKPDKLSGIDYRIGHGGCPVLNGTIAQFECLKESAFDGGDHTIFIGRVLNASCRDGDPLIFAGGDYRRAVAVNHGAGA
jgi:flavin reductase (DIM6/NTAB) family NADH-FMN oxidoreductase RutF